MEDLWIELSAIVGTVASTVWAAYQNWDDAPSWKKGLMVIGPIIMLGLVLSVVT